MQSSSSPVRIVVIGNGMVGYKFCEKLIGKASEQTFQITVFGEEPRPAYDRVHLSEYFAGKTVEDLTMAPMSWYQENNIQLVLGDPILDIDRTAKTVKSLHNIVCSYDYLILATGSSAFVPPIPGTEKEGVFVYRTIEDLDMMQTHAKKAKVGTVIGGGLLGLEAAKALLDLGLSQAHVVEFAPRLMPRQIDQQGSDVLKAKLETLGVQIHLSKNTRDIGGKDTIDAMNFTDETILATDMLVISAGIKPRDELAKKIGLEVGPRGGIVVNNAMQTSDPDIFAIGECALHGGMIYGLVAPGYDMADVVASYLTGLEKTFLGFDMSTKLKLIGVDVASFGDAFIEEPNCITIRYTDNSKGIYKRLNISTDGKYLLGGILVGDATEYNSLLQFVKNKTLLPPDPEDLILGSRGGEHSMGGVLQLPDEAIICSCESISKGALVMAIEDGNTSIDSLKKCCKAGTGCGGCVPMVKDLVQEVLKAQGHSVRNVLCEHIDYTRQEMYDLIKISGLKTYDEILDKYGKGDGCETCKPAVASMLASIYNELIVKQDTIQDTNDRYLANIQKNGTYSVVPRIPGGEITPEKLIVIGQVAQQYGLYTKITGGQRIDLFGAHVNDLPDIWEALILAGFESGHAYGKSLRTIKSCVGSTWCRFGVQDSVSFAILLEERYRGLRSPHKLKSAVSGCVRECAEAQSKDFGLIATEKGYNLFVCGNGGSKPRHADLLASDVDTETVIKYLDRFLMFYIKTADPLTRTSVWLDKMDGGIAYLKRVVLDDALGLAEAFENEMQFLVDTYKCEWKEVVDNPELRKKFKAFVNSDAKDPNVKFTPLRDQVKAAEWK